MTVSSPHVSVIYFICERVNFECKITRPANFSQSPFLGNFKRRKYLISISELCATTRRNENADDELPRGTDCCPAFFMQLIAERCHFDATSCQTDTMRRLDRHFNSAAESG